MLKFRDTFLTHYLAMVEEYRAVKYMRKDVVPHEVIILSPRIPEFGRIRHEIATATERFRQSKRRRKDFLL